MEYALLGSGGLALELAEYMLTESKKIAGYFAKSEEKELSDVIPYLGHWEQGKSYLLQYVIATGYSRYRKEFIDFILEHELNASSFISSRAYVSSLATIGKGAVITPFCSVAGNASLGQWVFMNVGSGIGHHAKTGDNVVIGPGSLITGHCILGNGVTTGANSALIPGTIVGDDAEIGIMTYPPKKVADGGFYLSMYGTEM